MNIFIVGQGGHSKVIQDIIFSHQDMQVRGFLDDKFQECEMVDNVLCGPISSAKKMVEIFDDIKFVIGIGNNLIRRRIVQLLNVPEDYYVTLVHKTAVISSSAKIGHGTVIMANSVVNADVVIGKHSIINTSAVIEHDNQIGDYVHVSPAATLTGAVQVEEGVHIGAGATVIPNITIGEWAVVGAGATVIHPIPAHSTAIGTPAKVKMKEVKSVEQGS